MKFILIFMFCLLIWSSYGLKASQLYKFNYFSSFKTGIPHDGDQASGVSLKAVLDVYIENQDGIAIFKLSDVTTVEFIEDLGCDGETEFPDDRFQPPKDKVFLSALEQPFRANLRGSQPFSIEYEETEHHWLSNFRKGIASIFKNEILKGNFETQEEKDSISSLIHEGHLVNIFSVEEETIFGICKIYYEIHEISDGFISTLNDLLPTQKRDSEESLWRVVRSVNFDKCKDKVVFNMHSTNEKRNKGEKSSSTRSSVSTYILQGSPGHFNLYSVVIEGVMTFPLSSFDENEAHSTTKQKLVLIDQTTNEEIPTLGPNLQHSTTWMFLVWSSFTLPKDSKPLPWIVYSDENNFNHPNQVYGARSISSDGISKLKVKILEIIETASKVLTDIDYETKDSQWQTVPDSLIMATYYFKMLGKEDIIKIFDHVHKKNAKLEWRLIIDTAATSGSHNAFEAILDYMSEGKLDPFQTMNFFNTLGSSDGTLNISRILDFVLEVNPLKHSHLSSVLLNFAHYLSEFCIHKTHNYNPANEPFIEDCSSVIGQFKTYLDQIIFNETFTWERTFAVKAYEVMKIHTSFNLLSHLIDGTIKSSNQLKAMVLRAFKNWTPDRCRCQSLLRKPVMDLLKEVYTDFNQDFHVRAAALVSYISWQPSTSFWHKLAQSTWHEPSRDFSSFTSYLINLYAEEKVPALEKQWKDAYSASKLAKATTNHQDNSGASIFDIFFKDYAKINVLSFNEKSTHSLENLIIQILTKEKGLNLLKFESYLMYSEFKNQSEVHEPHPNEFFEKFLKEISHDYLPFLETKNFKYFLQILKDAPNTVPPIRFDFMDFGFINFKRDTENENLYYGGRYLKLFETTDFFPNELGLPTFSFSSMPVVFSITTKNLPRKHGQVFDNRALVRASAVHNRGVAVYLPWSLKSYDVMDRSYIELNIPVGHRMKRLLGTEGPVRTTKNYYNIAFEKKFPVFRIANAPLTMIYNSDPASQDPEIIFVPIKKFPIEEKVISEIHPFTGIKYELKMNADTNTDFGLQDFQRFPRIPFRFWNLEFHINIEESETKELEIITSQGFLENSEGVTGKSWDSNKKYPTISISDTFVERSNKLTSFFEDSLRYLEFKYNLIGEKERRYELFAVETINPDADFTRLGFTRSQIPGSSSQPASFCFDIQFKSPSREERDSAFISHTNISQEIKLKFLFNCSHPLLKANALYSMSDEGRDDASGKCNSKYDDTEFYLKQMLLFDTIDIDATYATDLEAYDLVVTKDVLDSLKNWINFPSIKKFTDETRQGNVTLKIHRNTKSKRWDLHLKTSSEDILLATFSDNSLFKFVNGASGVTLKTIFDNLIEPEDVADAKCILQQNSVTTFDGVHYSYQPSTCWTLASHSRRRFRYRKDDQSAILIRAAKESSKIPAFKYLNFDSNVEIEFSNDELKVNGTIVDRLSDDSPDFKIIEKDLIYKGGHRYLIYHNENYNSPSVIISNDKIEIYDEGLAQTLANGLCGNNDGSTNPEFVGPKHCIYNDPQMFTASWTGHSDDCDAATLEEYRKGVDDFQANCKTYQKNEQDVHINKRCLRFGFELSLFDESKYCISAKPVPFCLSECQTSSFKNVKVNFKCWTKEKAPESLRHNIENKITSIFRGIPVEPQFYENFNIDVATHCKKF